MKTRTEKRIAAQVEARNLANQAVNDVYARLADFFRPFIGKQVTKKDGSLLAKIEKMLPVLDIPSRVSVYLNRSDYSLCWTCKACVSIQDDHGCVYDEQTSYVGKLSEGVLTEIQEVEARETDWTTEKLGERIANVERLRNEYQQAKYDLCGFNLY